MNTTVRENGIQTVMVDTGKLSRGLKTAFEGVAMIFDSLGTDIIPDMMGECKEQAKPSAAGTDTEKAETLSASEEKSDAVGNTSPEQKVRSGAEKNESPKAATPALTLDDVTKVIVQKIRKDRSNNEKIGEILKTFKAAKVSELPEEKYEAFLTELAAL